MSVKSRVLKAVTSNGGTIVQKFAQGEEPMRSVLMSHDRARGGICRTLVLRWLAASKKNSLDHSEPTFWQWLTPKGKVNAAAAGEVTIQHVNEGQTNVNPTDAGSIGRSIGGGAYLADQFRFRGLLPHTGSFFVGGQQQQNKACTAGQALATVASLAAGAPPNAGGYGFIGMNVGLKGHALGVIAGPLAANFRFFDPNLGEFSFPTAGNIMKWLAAAGARIYTDYTYISIEWYQ